MDAHIIKSFDRLISTLYLSIEYAKAMIKAEEAEKINSSLIRHMIKESACDLLNYPEIREYTQSLIDKVDSLKPPSAIVEDIIAISIELTKMEMNSDDVNKSIFSTIANADLLNNKLRSYSKKYGEKFDNLFIYNTEKEANESNKKEYQVIEGSNNDGQTESSGLLEVVKEKTLEMLDHVDASENFATALQEAVNIAINPVAITTPLSVIKVISKTAHGIANIVNHESASDRNTDSINSEISDNNQETTEYCAIDYQSDSLTIYVNEEL